jgi:hypothetical protein
MNYLCDQPIDFINGPGKSLRKDNLYTLGLSLVDLYSPVCLTWFNAINKIKTYYRMMSCFFLNDYVPGTVRQIF